MDTTSPMEYKDARFSLPDRREISTVFLPLAPQTVASTRFSPPASLWNPCMGISDALHTLDHFMVNRDKESIMVAISGPGDPLATPEITLEAVEKIKKRYPQITIGLKTMGIGSDTLASTLKNVGVDYIEMEVLGVQNEVLQKLYAWIRPGCRTLKISRAVEILISEQRNGVPALKFHNISVSIVTTLYPGYNVDHVEKISAEMMELGADTMSLIPHIHQPDAEVRIETPPQEIIAATQAKVKRYLPLAPPLLTRKCGKGQDNTTLPKKHLPQPSRKRPNAAVVSSNGIEIDLHLGHAIRFLIYGPRADGLTCLLETREAPAPGSGSNRWQQVADSLQDCFSLVVASAGDKPRRMLTEAGLNLVVTDDNIEGIVDILYGGKKKR